MHRIHNLTKRSRAYCAEKEKLHLYKLLISNRTNVNILNLFHDTPLHFGAKGKLGVCKLLISNGANVNALNKLNQTPLHYAAELGKVATCKFLISKGANINALDHLNNTALHFSAQQGKVNVCRLLVSHGARINCVSNYGFTPLHALWISAQRRYIYESCENKFTGVQRKRYIYDYHHPLLKSEEAKKRKLSVCMMLISNGANVNALNCLNETPLDLAAMLGYVDICKLLISHGTNIKASNNVKRWKPPPLNCAAGDGYIAICDLLISNGANIHLLDVGEKTPLHCAASRGKVAVCRLLISKGANVNALNWLNETPLNCAAREGYIAICDLLISNGANIHLLGHGDNTPLHWAASGGKVAVCKLLISKGANINAVNKMNMTPLDYTIHENESAIVYRSFYSSDSTWSRQVDVFKLLVENGANINNSCFMNCDTPLHFAVRHQLLSVSKLIISKGVDVNSLNGKNETPLMLSFSKKYVALTEYLLENKASYCPGGREYGRDIYSSMLTWLVKEVSLEKAITKKWFWRLGNLIFKTYDFSASTLKSSCRKRIREDEPHIKIGNNFKNVHIPKTLKEYLIHLGELVDLFEENICAEISSQAQVLFEETSSAETSAPRNKKRKLTNKDEQVNKKV
ncbi:putative ankyrin repeat protein RF_0381 [Artemia franciscana]